MVELNETFWTERYLNQQTGWDIGYVSTPIARYIDQLENKDLKILIPGAGNAYEAEYLWENGFQNIDVLDISTFPLNELKRRLPDLPDSQLLNGDFFELEGQYDLILEQTFFCALSPNLREAYVKKMSQLLKPEGKLVGLLFNIPLFEDRPPFGGDSSIYKPLFEKEFIIDRMEIAHNSVEPRANSELWISLRLR